MVVSIEGRISAARIWTDPYPHKIVDGVFPVELLAEIRRCWPSRGVFQPEIKGNWLTHIPMQGMWDPLPPDHQAFWRSFADGPCMEVARATVAAYLNPLRQKHGGDLSQVEISMLALMEADENYESHQVHTHHWHDPTYICTNLIYVEDGTSNVPGTTLYRSPADLSARDIARLAADKGNWHDRVKLATTVDFVPNRLLSFMDSPISYHGVEPAPNPNYGRRRIIRMHVRAPTSECERLYGVDYSRYRAARRTPSNDPQVVGWMEQDIAAINAPVVSDRTAPNVVFRTVWED
jgi:hypothetical protein